MNGERPRERCLENGPACLSLRECLALVLGSGPKRIGCLGLATRILEKSGLGLEPEDQEIAFFRAMESFSPTHLSGIPGIGDAQRARVVAAFELGKRYAEFRSRKALRARAFPTGNESLARQALAKISPRLRTEAKEWLGFVCLDRSGDVSGLCIAEFGVRTHVNVDPAELFARLLAFRPEAFVLFHNHPSGNLTPSPQDLDLTRTVGRLSSQLGVRLSGHWIVSSEGERWIDPAPRSSVRLD